MGAGVGKFMGRGMGQEERPRLGWRPARTAGWVKFMGQGMGAGMG